MLRAAQCGVRKCDRSREGTLRGHVDDCAGETRHPQTVDFFNRLRDCVCVPNNEARRGTALWTAPGRVNSCRPWADQRQLPEYGCGVVREQELFFRKRGNSIDS
jgi:hypothetical protein